MDNTVKPHHGKNEKEEGGGRRRKKEREKGREGSKMAQQIKGTCC